MSKRKKTLFIVLGIVIVLILVAVFAGGRRKGVQVATEAVERRTIIETVSASGRIQPEVEVMISAEVSGLILELPVKEGDVVAPGQLLVGINPDIYESALNRSEAAVNTAQASLASARSRKVQAEAQLVAAERAFSRSKELFEKGAVSQADYEQALSSFEVAKAEVEATAQSIKSAEFSIRSAEASRREAADNLNRTNLKAPMAGTVTALTKEVGEAVLGTSMMQGETIMKISDMSTMEVNVEVNESDIVRVSAGDTAVVEVDAYTGQSFTGIVTEISNTALNALDNNMLSMDQVTNFSVKVRILPESYAHLTTDLPKSTSPFRPGMSATVDIRTAKAVDALSIPIKAVTTRQDTSSSAVPSYLNNAVDEEDLICVFVYEDGKAALRVIETGVQDNKHIEIKAGIDNGEQVITGPYDQVSRKLRNGKRVELESDTDAPDAE